MLDRTDGTATAPVHLTTEQLLAGLDGVRQSPADNGVLRMIVRRPRVGEREVLREGELDRHVGLVGDTWQFRKSRRTADGAPHPDMQLNIINSRLVALIAPDERRWPLAGDQLYVDLDLSERNLPPGTRLSIGAAVIEVTAQPHTGCGKFTERFGLDVTNFVNSALGRELRLRGINARVLEPGTIRVADAIRRIPRD